MEIISKIYLSLSHAAAYSFVAYRTAYLKCHYPAQYFAALMTSMMDNAGKIALYTAECKRMGIKVLPPSVNYSLSGFTPINGEIRFGLMAIKNLGLGLIERLISEREQNGEYVSMYDFCLRNHSREFNRKALEGLIKSGALDGLEDNRRQMLYNIEGTLTAVENEVRFSQEGQLNLFEEMGAPNVFEPYKMPEMEESMKLTLEKEATGLYLSGHPMKKYSAFVENAGFAKTLDILSGKIGDRKRVTVAGFINQFKVRSLKNNTSLGSGQIEDMYSAVNITVFSKAYNDYKELLLGNEPVIFTGRISEREDRDTELLCEKIEPMPQGAERVTAKQKIKSGLYLKVPSCQSEEFTKVKTVLAKYSGNHPVIIVCEDNGRRLAAPQSLFVRENNGLIAELSAILGGEKVKFVK